VTSKYDQKLTNEDEWIRLSLQFFHSSEILGGKKEEEERDVETTNPVKFDKYSRLITMLRFSFFSFFYYIFGPGKLNRDCFLVSK
jgi:hypothetical protein